MSIETSFFLIWVTAPHTFEPRYMRSIESIVRHHPDARVTVLSNTLPSNFFQSHGLTSVGVEAYSLEQLTRGTPAEAWYGKRHIFNQSDFFGNHEADLLRLMTLFHRGGTYVDTDVFFVRPLRLPSGCDGGVGIESGEGGMDLAELTTSASEPGAEMMSAAALRVQRDAVLCNAVMSFRAGSSFLARAIWSFVHEYVPLTPGLSMLELYSRGEWGAMGPLLLTRLLLDQGERWGANGALGGARATRTCILRRETFYPIAPGPDAIAHFGPWDDERDAAVLTRILADGADGAPAVVAVHFWNALTRAHPLQCGSLMHRLFERERDPRALFQVPCYGRSPTSV